MQADTSRHTCRSVMVLDLGGEVIVRHDLPIPTKTDRTAFLYIHILSRPNLLRSAKQRKIKSRLLGKPGGSSKDGHSHGWPL
jgi:hypothetical protein